MASPSNIATLGLTSDITPLPNSNSGDSHILGLSSALIHSDGAYCYVIGLLLTLIGIKCNALGSNPFDGDMAIMVFFLETVFVYVIAITVTSRLRAEDTTNLSPTPKIICHVSGALSSELLLLILVTPIWCFIINVVLGLLVVTFWLWLRASLTLDEAHTREEREMGGTRMEEDIEAGNIQDSN